MNKVFLGLLAFLFTHSALADRPLHCWSIDGKYGIAVTGHLETRKAVVSIDGDEVQFGKLECEDKGLLPYECKSPQVADAGYRAVVRGTCHHQRVDLFEQSRSGERELATMECDW